MDNPPYSPLVIIPGDVDQARGYRITKWRTFDNYECLRCQYATLWIEKMQKHLGTGIHVWSYPSDTEGQLSQEPPPDDKLSY